MCFPELFPYGDGVFGLPRRVPMTFQQCVVMHLLRQELEYQVTPAMIIGARAWFDASDAAGEEGAGPHASSSGPVVEDAASPHMRSQEREGQGSPPPPRCACVQCENACQPFARPLQLRWGADRDLLSCYYDSRRRMEQVRKAKAHVIRRGFRERLECICRASAEKIDAAIQSIGERASVKDVLRAGDIDPDVKAALSELMMFTSEVIGSDGARARLRHEQNGYALMFGESKGFITPNAPDVRSPLMVVLHGAGGEEKYVLDLLDEESTMPSTREMLQIVAKDPVAQARFFITTMRLFCEHVLGSGPFDALLRHNGAMEGAAWPDGFAASLMGGAYGMVAAFHSPIEEQARLSIHPHIVLWLIHCQSERWLRSILRRETEEARELLRVWQEKVLATV